MKYLIAIIAIFAAQAFAAEPAYWMKEYPNAPQAKVDRCLIVAEDAYAKNSRAAWTVLPRRCFGRATLGKSAWKASNLEPATPLLASAPRWVF